MTQPDLALLTVDQIDKPKHQIVFALAADQVADIKAAKALDGTGVFRVGSDLPIGRVVGVELRKALGRAFVTVRFSDADAWNKAKAGVFRAGQCKRYEVAGIVALGSLNVVDAPFEDATVLRKAARESNPAAALRAALAAAGYRTGPHSTAYAEIKLRARLSKSGESITAIVARRLKGAVALASAQLDDTLAKSSAVRLDDAWWASQGCKPGDDGLYDFDPGLCRKRSERIRAEARYAGMNPRQEIRQ